MTKDDLFSWELLEKLGVETLANPTVGSILTDPPICSFGRTLRIEMRFLSLEE